MNRVYSKKYPTSCSLLVTENCNLRCKYCFEKHNKNRMTKETAEQALKFLFRNVILNGGGQVEITFFGGEPTLNSEVILYTIQSGLDMSEELEIPINFAMITNSVHLPKDLKEFLRKNKELKVLPFNVQLSIDGIKEVQNEYRVFPNGEGSFDTVERTMKEYIELLDASVGDVHVHGCINKKSMPYLYANYQYFKSLGLTHQWYLPIAEEEWGEEDVKLYEEQLTRITLEQLEECRKQNSILPIQAVSPLNKYGVCSVTSKPCGAGDSYCTITSNGDIYPCHQFYFNDPHNEMKLGNVYTGEYDFDVVRFFNCYDSGDLNCDKDCECTACYRCIAANFSNKHNCLDQKKGLYCEFMKIDKRLQNLIKKELTEMGLINIEATQHGKCKAHTSDVSQGCDVVQHKHECECGGNCQNDSFQEKLLAHIELLTNAVVELQEQNKRG